MKQITEKQNIGMLVFLSVPWVVSKGAGSDLPAYVSLAEVR